MPRLIITLLIVLTLNSCASIFNSRTTFVNITAEKKSKLVYTNDTILIGKQKTTFYPLRSKKPLEITILTDSLKEKFTFKRKKSILFWTNLPYTYGVGILIDLTNDKRFTYKHNLHFKTDTLLNKIVLNKKKVTRLNKNTLFLYTSPLQVLDIFSTPMLTLGTEYFLRDNFSLNMEYGIKYTNLPIRDNNISYLKNQGHTYRFEAKWYNGINLTGNVKLNEYLGLEYRLLKSQYNDNINYFLEEEKTEETWGNSITDDFATKKNVTIINLKYGLLVPIGKKLYFDFYTGFGLRIKRFKHINLEYDRSIHRIDYSDDFTLFEYRDFKEDYNKKSFFNYALGCKLGVKL